MVLKGRQPPERAAQRLAAYRPGVPASVRCLLLDDATSDPGSIHGSAEALAAAMEADLEALVSISSPSGDLDGAERALELCRSRLPPGAAVQRIPCSSPGHAPDLLARMPGAGTGRIVLLGHLDTVVAHGEHVPLERNGDHWRGSGTIDMKGGVALSLALARWLATRPELFGELGVLLVVDEEWRLQPLAHVALFAGYDACLCFEAGERTADGDERVIVRRKAAGTLQVTARGRAAHAGSNPDSGANALLALADAAVAAAALHDPGGADGLSVVPSVIRSGGAVNVVPPDGELAIDVRADGEATFDRVIEAIPRSSRGATIDVELIRSWPGMDSSGASKGLLAAAATRLGRPIIAGARGGASDASHFADTVPLTIDGLGPCGGHAHSPEEFVDGSSLRERLEVAMAICEELPQAIAGPAG